jgi:hypothetical protein
VKNENDVWGWVDKLIEQKLEVNESMTSGWNPCDTRQIDVKLSYARISDHKLYQRSFLIPMNVLRSITVDSIDAIITDILATFREDE